MATLLYIFPHPDDESFGPAPALARQQRAGHDVHLLTLTRGEATTQRVRLGYSKDKMGAVRVAEMEAVADALNLSSLTVLDLPDGALSALDPRHLEALVMDTLDAYTPDVVATYPVHGISGHPDHLVTHAVVKRAVCQRRAAGAATPKRLAFFTLPPPHDDPHRPDHLQHSSHAAIDCIVPVDGASLAAGYDALACYETYQSVVDAHQPLRTVKDEGVAFELFGEMHQPVLPDLTQAFQPDALPPPYRSPTVATGTRSIS